MDPKRLNRIAKLWAGIGVLVTAAILVVFQPWTTTLGPSSSPQRVAAQAAIAVTLYVPVSLYCMTKFAQRDHWYTFIGTYIPDSDNKVLGPRTLTSIAVLAAAFAAFGLFSVAGLDLAAMVAAFSAVAFGPIITGLSVFLGSFLRFALGGMGFMVPIRVPVFAVQDATNWVVVSTVFWTVIRSERITDRSRERVAFVGVLVVFLLVHASTQHWDQFLVNPWDAYLGWVFGIFPTFWPSAALSMVAGAIGGYALWNQYATDARKERVGIEPT